MTIALLSGLFGGNSYVNSASNSSSSCGCSSGQSSGNAQSGGGNNGGLLSNLLGAKTNLVSNLLGGITGGNSGGSENGNNSCGSCAAGGSSSSAGQGYGPVGKVAGELASGVHQTAETVISATGLGGLFSPIDKAVVHPLLWDPISLATGYDVSKHPAGVPDVTDPLGVRS